LKKAPSLFCLLFVFALNAQTADFKVQHIQDDIGRNGGTNTTFTTVNSINSTIALANNNRKTHAGSNTNSGTLEGDDMSGARQLTNASTLTYYRESGSVNRNMRFNTSLWEFIGPSGGGNEFIVRGRYVVSLNGGTSNVTQVLTGVVSANKCIPFITGISNNTTRDDADSGTAIAYLENATTLRVQKGSDDNNVTVYITVVEFIGANWTVLHGDSGNSNADTGTITLRDASDGTGTATNVSSWNKAAIFSHFRADTTASGVNDAIADLWPVIDPGSNNQTVDWTFHSNHDSAGTNRHFVHVLTNTGLNITRFQNNSKNAGETTIDITTAGLTDVNQALIIGSSTSSGNGSAYARGWRNYYLKSTTQAAHWSHRSNNTLSHEIQIVDLSGLQTTYPGPEINVQGNGVNIPDGNTAISLDDGTDFGDVEATGGASVVNTFTIQNLGSINLTLDDPSPYIVLTGDIADFTLTANPTTPITAAGTTTFTITYDPTTSGTHSATVSIANNDSDEDPYTFNIGGKGEYCDSNGSTTYDTSITYVSFNTITNADNEIPKDNGYEDFTNMSTNVYRNSTHNLTVRVNTDGNYTIYTRVWFDWNRDGDFDDAGEEYDMGSATNVIDGEPIGSPLAITIPTNAEIGSTRMRVATKWQSYPSSCDSGFDGEVEDYSINVIDYLIDFDGSDDLVDIGDNHDVTSTFSLESWVLEETTVATGTVISNGNIDGTLKTGYHLALKNSYPNLIWYDNANTEVLNITSPYVIPNNEWHHVAAIYDGTTAKLYVDGIEVISGTPSAAPISTPQNFKIGAETVNYATTPLRMNFLNGAIQEVRVWDIALSQDQIREMMNQKIEQDGTDVKGAVTLLNISGGLLWSNLLGYYPLDSNTAFDSSSYAIDGTPIDITSSQSVTAPIPYETDGDSAWDTSTTWLNSTDVYIPNTIGVDGVTAIDWNIVELTNDISSGTRDISLLGLISTTGTLTIDGTTNINTGTGTGQSLIISHYLELDGVIDLVGESQLVQSEGSIIDADSGGYLERDQQGTANSFNFNYWSSSVGPINGNTSTRGTGVANTNANYTISGVLNDGTNSALYQPITFNSSYTAADSNTPPIPITISSYWLYTFYGAADDFNAWISINENSSLLSGEGYTMKGSSGAANILTDFQNYVFKGMPYNGDITLALDKSSGEVDRLIGNPYPSAIDATQFILDNLSIADGGTNTNGTVFNGALYFWDHFGEENSHSTSDFVGGYATRNLTGGAVAISNDIRVNNTGALGTKVPGQYIPVNQGFFVSTALDGFNNDNGTPILTVDGGDIVFKNSQRVFATEGSGGSVFMRANSSKTKNVSANENVSEADNVKPTIRLMFDSPLGYHRQIVVGIDKNASNEFDFGYDAFIADINEEDMYWTFDAGNFVIQGVNNFSETQEFAIGLKVKQAGLINIRIEALENIDTSLDLYIKDNTTGQVYQINNEIFQIYLDAGTYNNRFKLVFQKNSNVLSEDDVTLKDKFTIYYDSRASEIKIIKPTNSEILGVNLYNVIGQRIESLKYSSGIIPIPTSVNSGVYIVKLNTTRGIISKRVIIE
jgi:Concanavalin A-like lectin/glucanases superfamily/GEVED domain